MLANEQTMVDRLVGAIPKTYRQEAMRMVQRVRDRLPPVAIEHRIEALERHVDRRLKEIDAKLMIPRGGCAPPADCQKSGNCRLRPSQEREFGPCGRARVPRRHRAHGGAGRGEGRTISGVAGRGGSRTVNARRRAPPA
jgi:hypothetical protein